MFRWARGHPDRPVVISGHTHRPVFWDSRPPVPAESDKALAARLEELRAAKADKKELAELHARIESNRAEARAKGPPPIEIKPPCYFNTGCCSFGDGDITGIEIAEGHIRLVRWPDDSDEPKLKCLVQEDLATILDHVAAGATAPSD
jgi:hypothetical protein